MSALNALAYLAGGRANKKNRTVTESAGGPKTSGAPSGDGRTSSDTAKQPQQQSDTASRSYAQAARKRAQPTPPTFPRPSLVRGEPLFKHDDYESLERPAPNTTTPNRLYVDMRKSSLTADLALDAVIDLVGNAAVGFQVFAAQKTLALLFSSADTAASFCDKAIGDTGLTFHAAPPAPAQLIRLTLQGVPVHDLDTLKLAFHTLLPPSGTLLFAAPMVKRKGDISLMSDQWHVTYGLPAGTDPVYPDPIVNIMGLPVIVDVPGERRFCRHCMDVQHTRSNCRQFARERQCKRQQQQENADPRSAFLDTTPPPPPSDTTTTAKTTTTTTNRTTPENWEDADLNDQEMELEDNPQASAKAALARQVLEAESILERARSHPSSVSEDLLTKARRFLASQPTKQVSGSGDNQGNQ